jgi:hypothetical protein
LPLVSQREYARLKGVSHTAVAKAVRKGKIALVDGKVDTEAAAAQWEGSRDARQPSKMSGEVSEGSNLALPLVAGDDPEARGPAEGTLAHAQYRREVARAAKAEIELQVQQGKLVERADIELKWAALVISVRDRLLLIGDKLAPRLASSSDALECRAMVDRAIREALAALSVEPAEEQREAAA